MNKSGKIIKGAVLILAMLLTFSGMGLSTALAQENQIIEISSSNLTPRRGNDFSISVNYDVSDNNNMLGGINLAIHFDSSKIEYTGYSGHFNYGSGGALPILNDDTVSNSDNDTNTDKRIFMSWWDLTTSWPNATLPVVLSTLNFTVKQDAAFEPTPINVAVFFNSPGYGTNLINGTVTIVDIHTCINYTDCSTYETTEECPDAPPEICNNEDDDCDASTLDGADEVWLDNQCDGDDADFCLEGTFECSNGAQICNDTTTDNIELCNGQDDDCNPATADGANESWLDNPCDGDDADFCIEGTLECSNGLETCNDTTADNIELCNGQDDDCNPATADGADESWLGGACDGDDADLCETGKFECSEGEQICAGDILADDLCDGIDNDCDITTPDGSAEGWYKTPCDGDDLGLCLEGNFECSNGTKACTDDTEDDPDFCDGNTDDDCDPSTPDGAAEAWLGDQCDGDDLGLCLEGNFECSKGTKTCNDNTEDDPDLCNGSTDDDCDPSTPDGAHEAWLDDQCDGDDLGLCQEGAFECSNGAQTCNDLTADDLEVCNNKDDDCDGSTDEDLGTTTCGLGVCEHTVNNCVEGLAQECDPFEGSSNEIYDGLDNDCDGDIDEDFSVIYVTVTKNPTNAAKNELILFGESAIDGSSVNEKVELYDGGEPDQIVVPYGDYSIIVQSKGYKGQLHTDIFVDFEVLEKNFTLEKKEDPSVSIIREGVDDNILPLHFRYNNSDGEAQTWDNAGATLSVSLFSSADDSNNDGLPDDPDNPTGGNIDDLALSNDGVFNVPYLSGTIDLGDLNGAPQNIMSETTENYIVGIRGKIQVQNQDYYFNRFFTVQKPSPTQTEALSETQESFLPTEISTKTYVPLILTIDGARLTTSFAANEINPTLLGFVDENGNKTDADLDMEKEVELKIEYKETADDKIVVNVSFSQNGNPVEYNPPDSTGATSENAPPITIIVPLAPALQDLYQNQGKTKAEIAEMIAKDEDDFELVNGVLQPEAGLYGIYFETSPGIIKAFIPDAAKGESIELIDLNNSGKLAVRVNTTHTSLWYTTNPENIDADGDGYNVLDDCDDLDENVNKCTIYYKDADGDGKGDNKNDHQCLCRPEGEYTALTYKKKTQNGSTYLYNTSFDFWGGGLYSGNFNLLPTYQQSWIDYSQMYTYTYSIPQYYFQDLWNPYSYNQSSYWPSYLSSMTSNLLSNYLTLPYNYFGFNQIYDWYDWLY